MKRIDAYLFFENNCREAMAFYQSCFGGELFVQTVGQSPMAGQMPPHMADAVMHASLKTGDAVIMASDNCMGGAITQGKNVSLCIACHSDEELYNLYEKLSAGGNAAQPPKVEFWGDTFGSLTDKYGFDWMLINSKQ